MSQVARREATRLLLLNLRWLAEEERFDEDDAPEYWGLRRLRRALAELSSRPKRYSLVKKLMSCSSDPTPRLEAPLRNAFDETIDLLTRWMPEVIPAPLWSIPYDSDFVSVELDPDVAAEIRKVNDRVANMIEDREEPGGIAALSRQTDRDFDAEVIDSTYGEGWREEKSGPGVSFEHTGRTGAPTGRPRRGTRDPQKAGDLLLQLCPDRTIDELRGSLKRGKPTAETREIRAELKAAVRELSAAHRASHKALADALQCGVRAVDRLAASN